MDPVKCVVIAGLWICAVVEQLHPQAAMGASFGCFAFLGYQDPSTGSWFEKFVRKMTLLIFSWGAGYAFASGVSTSDWSGWTMLAAIGASALAAGFSGALNLMVRNNGPLPQWLSDIVDRIPVLRKRNDDQP